MSARRRHVGSRENPEEGTCLGVFGLSLYTTERELDKEFSKFGPLQKVQVVLDGKVSIFFAEKNNQNFLYLHNNNFVLNFLEQWENFKF